ncbi:hypothetical protein BS50DRAFT_573288 [Corynespora cassiicola Philippines]|uniref:Uncharacterized protein n=1 Tax=Corynespora cassiicola Philippines TaxID=1448308 RepID=A0A2T2NSL0_CORCC|nr:hypothetical protein BS50DRAFT_573288 [Corynespora cassiicola Philippines]
MPSHHFGPINTARKPPMQSPPEQSHCASPPPNAHRPPRQPPDTRTTKKEIS